jgi:hypothetical protein
MVIFCKFSDLEISQPRDYNIGFNHFILKHKNLRKIMKCIKDVVDYTD